MKALICIFLVWMLSYPSVMFANTDKTDIRPKGFDSQTNRTKKYIVKALSKAIRESDIGILHSRCDEWLRTDKHMDYRVRAVLGLLRFRLTTILKGCSDIGHYDLVYFYYPTRYAPRQTHIRRANVPALPYFSSLTPGDELMRLVFMQPQTSLLRKRIINGYRRRPGMEKIVTDALDMEEDEFIDKYNLQDVFENRVYQLAEGCVFQVDYPIPEMPVTKAMRMNWDNLQLTKAHIPEVQKHSNLVHLSSREVSEIVFIAYLMYGEDGIAKYAEACAENDQILLPISEPIFETEIGRMLFEAVTKNADTNADQSISFDPAD